MPKIKIRNILKGTIKVADRVAGEATNKVKEVTLAAAGSSGNTPTESATGAIEEVAGSTAYDGARLTVAGGKLGVKAEAKVGGKAVKATINHIKKQRAKKPKKAKKTTKRHMKPATKRKIKRLLKGSGKVAKTTVKGAGRAAGGVAGGVAGKAKDTIPLITGDTGGSSAESATGVIEGIAGSTAFDATTGAAGFATKTGVKVGVKAVKAVGKQTIKTIKTATRTIKTAQTTRTAARATAQATKAAAKAAATGVKAVAQAIAAAGKALVSGASALIAAAGGGGLVLIIIIVVCIIGALANSIFGIFFNWGGGSSSDPTAATASVQTIQTIAQELGADYAQRIMDAQGQNPDEYDEVEVNQDPASWREILAVYAIKINTDADDPQEIVTMDDTKAQTLKNIFWAMNTITVTTERRTADGEVLPPETEATETTESQRKDERVTYKFTEPIQIIEPTDGTEPPETTEPPVETAAPPTTEPEEETTTVLVITVTHKTADEMATQYNFSHDQLDDLDSLLASENDSLWVAIFDGVDFDPLYYLPIL